MHKISPILVIACGALAHELTVLQRQNAWQHVQIRCLPADLHQRPERIAQAVERLIQKYRPDYPEPEQIFVAYGDCGTGGQLDVVLARHQVQRLQGPHCYTFFAGQEQFDALAEEELGSFYLTDFLLRHFDRLVWQGLGLEKHPELLPLYFGNYRRLVYLAQAPTADRIEAARAVAQRLGLIFKLLETGFAPFAQQLSPYLVPQAAWQPVRLFA